jgi:hypothetical protein
MLSLREFAAPRYIFAVSSILLLFVKPQIAMSFVANQQPLIEPFGWISFLISFRHVTTQDSVAQRGHDGEEAATIIPVATPDEAGLDADGVILLTGVYIGMVHKNDLQLGHVGSFRLKMCPQRDG